MTENASVGDAGEAEGDRPWVSSGATDLGAVRKLNEDAFLDRSEVGLWVVADGMGGHSAGDFASKRIVESLEALAVPIDPEQFADAVEGTLLTVHDELTEEAERRGPNTVIGSTVLATLLAGNQATTLWAGDSRLYRMRGGHLTQLTRDHSLVQDLVDAGELTSEQAEHHPQSNIITRAVGAGDDLEIERRTDRVAPGDILLLCSDGLGRVVPPEDIVATLSETPVEAAAGALIDKALAFRTTDNVTAIVVRIDGVPDAAAVAGPEDDDEPTEPGTARPRGDESESTLPSAWRAAGAAAPEIDTVPDFGPDNAGADREIAPGEEAADDAIPFSDSEGGEEDDWRPISAPEGDQPRDLTMIGVPPRRTAAAAMNEAPAGKRAARGWPAILLVAAGFAVILAALYLL
ncbi:MAG: hypothetical protein GVY13_15375 [Alphaproteobacteria bacterium]|jgi:serine/threonine protein phosphatase PrpC|nr:hypothetical protein [Alphaproteobacteria bacterium]